MLWNICIAFFGSGLQTLVDLLQHLLVVESASALREDSLEQPL